MKGVFGRRSARWLALALLMIVQQASGACSVSAQGVSFGGYDVFGSQPLDGTGNIAVSCNPGTSYTLSLSPGGGSYASRAMANGAHRLGYNLYTDATRTVIWGDGSGGTAIVSGSGTTANHTVYGRIPERQNAHVGSYSDTITVTLNF